MTDYSFTCRHCGGRFVEMIDLLFHPCPPQRDAHKPVRTGDRRRVKGKGGSKPRRRIPAGREAF